MKSFLIIGNLYNIITGETQGISVIVGGKDNVVGYGVTGNFIGGGRGNQMKYGSYSSINGGFTNCSINAYNTIGGGRNNTSDYAAFSLAFWWAKISQPIC